MLKDLRRYNGGNNKNKNNKNLLFAGRKFTLSNREDQTFSSDIPPKNYFFVYPFPYSLMEVVDL